MFGLKKRTWLTGGVVAALLGTGALAARWHEHSPEERAQYVTGRISDKLNLNDTQRAEFEKVADAYVQIRGTAPEFMVGLSGRLKELAAEKTLTVEEVNTLRDQIRDEFERRADIMIPQFVSFYNSLDENRKDMVNARLEKMSARLADIGEGRHHGKWRHLGDRFPSTEGSDDSDGDDG